MIDGPHMSRFGATIFGIVVLGLGLACLLFPYQLISVNKWLARGNEDRFSLFKLSLRAKIIHIRISGALGILLGLFVLWATWRTV